MQDSKPSLKWVFILILGAWALHSPALGLPSFARQTGLSCATCHTVFPELNSFGREFKLTGYVNNNTEQLQDGDDKEGYRLQIAKVPPIAAMIQLADTFTQTPPPGVVSNGSDGKGQLEFPSQFSLFYAGALSPKMGAFVQVTYDSASGAFGFDNTDLRLADKFKLGDTDLILGLSLNNNPTVQDPFNSLPAWGFPYSGGNTATTPSIATLIESLGGSVGGLGGYLFWDDLIYAELAAYRTAPQGGPASSDIQGYAPYYRVALTKDFDTSSIEGGIFGLRADTYPDGAPVNNPADPMDSVSDFGVDLQYQYIGKEHSLTLKGSCIWEDQTWAYTNGISGGTTNPTDTFRSLKADLTYYYDGCIGATLGFFNTSGSNDPLLYSAMASNIPDSQGWIFEVNYLPWENTKFTFQYTLYDEFDGGTTDYDGAGRNASDNNTAMVMAWLLL